MEDSQDIGIRALYDAFLDEICETEIVWGLANEQGWAVCDSNDFEGRQAIPFWSTEKLAAAHCVEDWSSYLPHPIPLEEFLNDWMHGMHQDELLVGTNWDDDLVGPEIEPLMIIEEIEGEE